MAIQKIKAKDRFLTDYGWGRAYRLFSAAEYVDSANERFGALEVFTDGKIEPGGGMDSHDHFDEEVVTVMLEGSINHKDNLGNDLVMKAGEVSVMSAGKGCSHSEYNRSDRALHLYQFWIIPPTKGLEPYYLIKDYSSEDCRNKLLPIVSGQGHSEGLAIRSDAVAYLCDLDAGGSLDYEMKTGRLAFVYMREGDVVINGVSFGSGDQAR
ncbi:MAG: pirin family protein, partial [Spirochaetota bacterium]|nr:pirin family protein [Spirochaetota bacterium]